MFEIEDHFLNADEIVSALEKNKLDRHNPIVIKTINTILEAVSDKLENGISVSVDVSQGEEDAYDRVFAVSCGFQITRGSHGDIDILSVKESQNY